MAAGRLPVVLAGLILAGGCGHKTTEWKTYKARVKPSFSCLMPPGWRAEEDKSSRYPLIIFYPKPKKTDSAPPPMISVRFYPKEGIPFKTLRELSRNLALSFKGKSSTALQKTKFHENAAFSWRGWDKQVYPPRSLDAKEHRINFEHLVFEDKANSGFWLLQFFAPADAGSSEDSVFKKFLDAFELK